MTADLIIFDFDGTLADSLPVFVSAVNEIAPRFRFRQIDPSELEHIRTLPPRQLAAHLGIPSWKTPLIARAMRKSMAQRIGAVRLFPRIDDALHQLAACGKRMGIVTSNSEANVRAVLGARAAALFEYYECGVSMFGKGSRFARMLRRSGVAPERAISVGDEIRDIEAARQVGLRTAAVTWGFTAPAALRAHAPSVVFESVPEMVAALT